MSSSTTSSYCGNPSPNNWYRLKKMERKEDGTYYIWENEITGHRARIVETTAGFYNFRLTDSGGGIVFTTGKGENLDTARSEVVDWLNAHPRP